MDNVNNGWGSVYTSTDIQDNVLTFLKCDIMIDEKNIDDEDFKLFLEDTRMNVFLKYSLMDTLCQNLATYYYYQDLVIWS